MWEPSCKKAIKDLKPDLVVCDFYTRLGVEAADEMGIPSVINNPGPVEHLKNFEYLPTADLKYSSSVCSSLCGCICIFQSFNQCLGLTIGRLVYSRKQIDYFRSWVERPLLINSFWGLDRAQSLPPNYFLTGPLSKPSHKLMDDFERKDPDLLKWMDKALEDNQPVVVVTIGSEMKW